MIGTRRILLQMQLVAAILLLLAAHSARAQASGAKAKPPAPSLMGGGGANPTEIPNDVQTDVTLGGFHLLGSTLTTGPLCKLVSYHVVSDTQIKMTLKGTRTVADKDDTCTMTVSNASGHASTWIVVDLTDAQQQQQTAQQNAEDQAKATAFLNRAGNKWTLHFAGGATDTFTSTGANPDGMPTFKSSAGTAVQIAVAADNSVTIIETGCIRSGKMTGTQVTGGQSMGQCTPPGSWTATVEQ